MNTPTKDGAGTRAHLLAAARMGSAEARAALQAPECPEHMEWLYVLGRRLLGRSGVGMDGFAPLNPLVAESHARMSGLVLEPQDYEALLDIDTALRRRPDDEPSSAESQQEEKPDRPWPTRKVVS